MRDKSDKYFYDLLQRVWDLQMKHHWMSDEHDYWCKHYLKLSGFILSQGFYPYNS